MTSRRMVLAVTAVVFGLIPAGEAAHAQGFIRGPNLNIAPRITAPTPPPPTINPNVGGRINDVTPNLSTSGNCPAAYRSSSGECLSQPTGTQTGSSSGSTSKSKKANLVRNNGAQATVSNAPVELVAEFDGALTDAQADELARRHRLRRISSQSFPLINATIGLFRIADRRSAETVSRELAGDAAVRSVQPNYRYVLQEDKVAPVEGDPAQYAVRELRLPQAHTLAHGSNVIVAVIDSGIDIKHPELADSVIETFDALGSGEGPHVHGTGIAGAIAAHARLIGSAPQARLLAIRAFGAASNGAESTSYVILKSFDFAAAHGARIVNMSFAGPKDRLIERGIAALAAKGVVMVAAAGNAGAKSPPLYPAADANVIAVSATDAQDRLFSASNRGDYVALAAPGVDIFLPAPDQKYQMASGTSFSAAYVSGIAALMLERDPALKPDELRALLAKSARDLGSPGRDDLFGAGEADAYAAVQAAVAAAPAAVASTDQAKDAAKNPAKDPAKADENTMEQKETAAVRAESPPPTAVAAEKSAPAKADPADAH
jgi:subtilisin family serine protease